MRPLAICALLLACAHVRTPEQKAMVKRGDCAELLRAADAARADGDGGLAAELAAACPQDRLLTLIDAASPAQALLWCGRATAAQHKGCGGQRVIDLTGKLGPHLTLGPPDEAAEPDPMLAAALEQLGKELNLEWEAEDPDVIVGKLTVTLDHLTFPTVATVADAKGGKQRVPATQHRFVARVEAQVELADKTRTLHATEEERDNTWEAAPRLSVAAKFEPSVPSSDDLKKRAVVAWLRVLARALAAEPPEDVDVEDDKGCVAYGLALNIAAGNPLAAAQGLGDPDKVSACEKLLGEPPGAGIPVP
jgi:hypothetical protein